MDLSIIVPAYNEEKRIGSTLDRIGKFFTKRKKNIKAEVLVMVNNTTDNTVGVVKQYQKKYPFIKYANIRKYTGKGGAVLLGFKKAQGTYVAFMDSDGASAPSQVYKLYNVIKRKKSLDGVIASRYLPSSQIKGFQPLSRRIYSRLFNKVVRYGLGLNFLDTQCGMKIFKNEVAKEFVNRVSVYSWTFDVNLLLIAKQLGFNIQEVPTRWTDIPGSKLNTSKAVKEVPVELFKLKKYQIEFRIAQWFSNERSLLAKTELKGFRVELR